MVRQLACWVSLTSKTFYARRSNYARVNELSSTENTTSCAFILGRTLDVAKAQRIDTYSLYLRLSVLKLQVGGTKQVRKLARNRGYRGRDSYFHMKVECGAERRRCLASFQPAYLTSTDAIVAALSANFPANTRLPPRSAVSACSMKRLVVSYCALPS
jgi:hypothetical protein